MLIDVILKSATTEISCGKFDQVLPELPTQETHDKYLIILGITIPYYYYQIRMLNQKPKSRQERAKTCYRQNLAEPHRTTERYKQFGVPTQATSP